MAGAALKHVARMDQWLPLARCTLPAARRLLATSVVRLQAADNDNEELRQGTRTNVHFRLTPNRHPLGLEKKRPTDTDAVWPNPMEHAVWTREDLDAVKQTHLEPEHKVDRRAFKAVKAIRGMFDTFSGWRFGELTTTKVLLRCIFLETIAGVPGMAAAMARHLRSLRLMQRDHGWIHTLLEEAENERMHLLTFMTLYQPGMVFRLFVAAGQGVFLSMFSTAYLISPRFCHRMVGYIEEEAVTTYTKILAAMDSGKIQELAQRPAPPIAISYWQLPSNANMRTVFEAVRADEANHRDVNHTFASLEPDATNPYILQQTVASVKAKSQPTDQPAKE